jgi:Ca-activated chloride channel family protein
LHIGAALVFVGCITPRYLGSPGEPVEVRMVEESKPITPLPPPPPMLDAMFAPSHSSDAPAYSPPMMQSAPAPTAQFASAQINGTALAADEPVSTFSVDVDTASYSMVRRSLTEGVLPPAGAVRVEEMVNYFPYQYAGTSDRGHPFQVSTELMPSPWKAGNQLIHIALRGYDVAPARRPRANVVLLVDVSGSMSDADRLPLLQRGFRSFVAQLRDDDLVSIVTYASGTGTALEPTLGKERSKIMAAIDALAAGGATAGADGLERAYALAEQHFDKQAINRVLLATDGDFNLGISNPYELEKFIVRKRNTGIYLSILGVGYNNLNDHLIQRLTQAGNGNAAYIDTLFEAKKAMSEAMGANMIPIANDVKVQVAFDPRQVAAYRLVGYETRMLKQDDFQDDRVDAGDMGAGHTVTAIYEITPLAGTSAPAQDALCTIRLRYKLPGDKRSLLTEHQVHAASARTTLRDVPPEPRFAVAVAAFGQRLRAEKGVGDFSYAQIAKLGESARGADPQGYRAEFVQLVKTAQQLSR